MVSMQFSERLIFGLSLVTLLIPVAICVSIDFMGKAKRQERSAVCNVAFQSMLSYTDPNYVSPYTATVGDFNNDNILDIVVANSVGENIGIQLGNGNGTFLPPQITFVGNNIYPQVLAVADFNNDHQLDVAFTSWNSGTFGILLGNGDGTVRLLPLVSMICSSQPLSIRVADFNKDNIVDLAIATYGHSEIRIFTGNGNGTFQSQKPLPTGTFSKPRGMTVGDVNNDNNTDVVTANFGTNQVSVFLGYGNGSFGSQMTFSVGNYPYWIEAAYFNGDNYLDVVVVNQNDQTIGVLLGIGNGSFSAQTTYSAPGSVYTTFFTIGDINNDGKQDIVLANSYVNTIGVFLGQGDGTFLPQTSFGNGTLSWLHSVTVADFNRDNVPDVVVTDTSNNDVGVFIGTC